MIIKGRNILFSLAGEPIACSEQADIVFSTSFLPARQPDSTIGEHSIPQKISFQINIGGPLNFVYRSFIYLPQVSFSLLDFSFFTAEALDGRYDGQAWVQSWGEQAPTAGLARYNASFKGEGLPTFIEATGVGSMEIEGTPEFEVF